MNVKQMKNEKYNNSNYTEESKKLNNIKTTIKVTLILTLSVLILVIVLITTFSTILASNLAFLKYKFYVMESTSQQYIANEGDLVIAKKAQPGEVVKGDRIVFKGNNFYYCDDVVETRKINTVYKMIIAECEGVKYQFEESEIEGKVVKIIPGLGSIVLFLRTPLGILFFSVFIICVFLLLRILLVETLKHKYNNSKKNNNKQQKNSIKTTHNINN